MANLPFFPSISSRMSAGSPSFITKNRYAEPVNILNDGQVSLVARPAMKKFAEVGTGHIRKLFSQPGVFDDALFVVSGTELWSVSTAGVSTFLGPVSADPSTSVSMCATAPIGTEVPAYLFIAEGGVLSVWTDKGNAIGVLTASGTINNGDQVRIDGVYYQFTTGPVDTGSPAGTSSNPWLVARGLTTAEAMTNLYDAINESGTAGTSYSTPLTKHTTVVAYNVAGSVLYVGAVINGTAGNTIVTTETGANMSWGAGTLTGGGSPSIRQILVPDEGATSSIGAISVAVINGYVIVVPKQTATTKGRFYFIKPGEITINPLDYATAERSPDGVHQVVVFGEFFWLLGQETSEPWITTGDSATPVAKFQGQLYDRGSWNGSAVQVKDSLILVDQNGGVFQIAGGANRISTPEVEEMIRRAITKAALLANF